MFVVRFTISTEPTCMVQCDGCQDKCRSAVLIAGLQIEQGNQVFGIPAKYLRLRVSRVWLRLSAPRLLGTQPPLVMYTL